MLSQLKRLMVLTLTAIVTTTGAAAEFSASFNSLGGTNWQVEYSILNTNDFQIHEFTVFFGLDITQSIESAIAPGTWDMLVVQPDHQIPSDGYVDGLNPSVGISPNSSLTQIIVSFSSLVQNPAIPQRFEIRDLVSFALLESGFTSVSPVPEANKLICLLLGCLIVAMRVRTAAHSPAERLTRPRWPLAIGRG